MQVYINEVKTLLDNIETTLLKLDSIRIPSNDKKDVKEWLRYSWLMLFNVYDTLNGFEESKLEGFNWN